MTTLSVMNHHHHTPGNSDRFSFANSSLLDDTHESRILFACSPQASRSLRPKAALNASTTQQLSSTQQLSNTKTHKLSCTSTQRQRRRRMSGNCGSWREVDASQTEKKPDIDMDQLHTLAQK